MRKLFVALVASILMTGFSANANTINLITADNLAVSTIVQEDDEASGESVSFTQELKTRFIEGGPGFMGIVLICLILGLAIAIERIIFLNLATTNTKKLTDGVEEGIANVVLEAMALKTLVLSTDCGGMDEVIQDGLNGYLIPIRDSEAIAKKIIQISKIGEHEKKKVQNKALETIQSQHTTKLMVDGMIKLYKSVL